MTDKFAAGDDMLLLPKFLMLMYRYPSNEMERTFVPSTIEELKDEEGRPKVMWLREKFRIELTLSEYVAIRNSEYRLKDIDMYVKDPDDWAVCEVVVKQPTRPYMAV